MFGCVGARKGLLYLLVIQRGVEASIEVFATANFHHTSLLGSSRLSFPRVQVYKEPCGFWRDRRCEASHRGNA